jgi:hypothetical protein
MRGSRNAAFFMVLCLGLASFAIAQVGHPAKGTWLGYWGPSEKEQRRLVLQLDWDNNQVVGVLNPGPKSARITHSQIDYETWTLTIEADLPNAAGKPQHWVATGKLENLGSWSNRRYKGTYKFGAETGSFLVTLH